MTDADIINHLAGVVTRIQTDKRYNDLFKLHKYRCNCAVCDTLNIPEHNFCICDSCKLQLMDASAELAGALKLADQILPGVLSRNARTKIDLFNEGE